MQPKPSTSAKKREHLARQALGEQLVGLAEEQLRGMGLDENLIEALTAAAKIRSRGALRRQRQLIGKLMRDVDPEPLRQALDVLQFHENNAKETFRRAEEWRDRIVRCGRSELEEFFHTIGHENEELSTVLDEYFATPTDSGRRALRRKIFRLVHKELTTAEVTIE